MSTEYQGRAWCWTLNNPTDNDTPRSLADHGALYCVWQLERGATTQTPHLQGYTIFKTPRKLSVMKNYAGFQGAHFERRMGNHEQARDYCKKEDGRLLGPWEYGEEPAGQGRRNDLLTLKRSLEDGKSEREICDNDELFPTWTRYYKSIERWKRLHTSNMRTWATYTTVLWGPPGTGKTKYCLEHGGEHAYWMKKPIGNAVYFDGYEGQEIVIIDEFYGWLPFDLLCRMCDRYPLMVDTKGGMTNFYPKQIFITSNQNPNDWYKNGLGALRRRISEPLGRIVSCDENWDGLIKACIEPNYFPTAQASISWHSAHASCTESICFVATGYVDAFNSLGSGTQIDDITDEEAEQMLMTLSDENSFSMNHSHGF